jgi:hypothetical protein
MALKGMALSLALLLPIQAAAVDRSELSQVPLPDLSTMGDATRRRLEVLQERVAELTLSASDGKLAKAYGTLGRYYIAHHLNDAAGQAIPESVELLHALARLLASADDPEVRDGERAVELARRTLRAGSTLDRIETLAMASAQAGLFDEAIRLQRELIRTVTWHGQSDVLPRLEANLARYRAGLTCCAPWPVSE